MSVKISKDDYLIIVNNKKEHLVRALEDSPSSNDMVESILERMCHISSLRHTFTLDKKDLVLNLGPQPRAGKVYGQDVSSIFYKRKTHDDFGDINFFYKPDKNVVKDLWEAMGKTQSLLKKRGLEFLTDNIVWEVLPYHGEKFAGCFIKSKNDKIPDRIQIRPEIVPANMYIYVLTHELAHNLHFNYVTSKKLNALWLKLFNTSIKVSTVKKEVSAALLENLLAQEDPPSAFKGQLGEEEALAFKWIVRTISQGHNISIHDLDTLFEADMKEEIRKLWPIRTIPRKELAPIISDYATKSYRELFAEVYAFIMTGKKVPEPIVRLMDKSISYAKVNREKNE
jgi:hypothetical protein